MKDEVPASALSAFTLKPLTYLHPTSPTAPHKSKHLAGQHNPEKPCGPRAWSTTPHPTAPLLATCLSDKTVRVYNIADLEKALQDNASEAGLSWGTLHSTIEGGHKRSVRACAWKPNLNIYESGERNWRRRNKELVLATASFDASVGIWRRVEGPPNADEAVDGHEEDCKDERGMPQEIDLTTAPKKATGLPDHDVDGNENEDDDDWRFAIVLDGHESEVKSVAWSAGGNFLATCSRDKSVWIWEEVDPVNDEYETIAVLQEHEGDVKSCAWHPEEELLASGSYDDEIRLWRDEGGDDWGCVWVGRAHKSTVWMVGFEGLIPRVHDVQTGTSVSANKESASATTSHEGREAWLQRRRNAGPRLISCSDDGTIKIWRRIPRKRAVQSQFSIIKNPDAGEEWLEEATLPQAHSRSIYAVAWSSRTGLVASCGGDGKVAVYQEIWPGEATPSTQSGQSAATSLGGEERNSSVVNGDPAFEQAKHGGVSKKPVMDSQWRIVAQVESAHGMFELNHVTWAPRAECYRDKEGANTSRIGCEWLVTTGDDGVVQVWDISLA